MPKFYRVTRQVHLYMALFLVPWMVMFAISTIAMNHLDFFARFYEEPRPGFITEREIDYRIDASHIAKEALALRILDDLNLQGKHNVRGSLENGTFEIRRDSATHIHRVTYRPETQKLVVERQEFRPAPFLNRLHSRRGYGHGTTADNLWAIGVDAVILAIMTWALSGVYLWLAIKRTRKTGALCLVVGFVMFAFFLLRI